jgi:hypothetical protein
MLYEKIVYMNIASDALTQCLTQLLIGMRYTAYDFIEV